MPRHGSPAAPHLRLQGSAEIAPTQKAGGPARFTRLNETIGATVTIFPQVLGGHGFLIRAGVGDFFYSTRGTPVSTVEGCFRRRMMTVANIGSEKARLEPLHSPSQAGFLLTGQGCMDSTYGQGHKSPHAQLRDLLQRTILRREELGRPRDWRRQSPKPHRK